MEPEYHVMLDLETMGTGNDAAIVAIGATKFIPYSSEPYDRFYINVDLASAMKFGGQVSAGTVMWWLRQDEKARRSLMQEPLSIVSALEGFTMWYGTNPNIPVWGNGATFDNVILRSAYARLGFECPWSYKSDRCFRTLKSIYYADVAPPDNDGIAHNALDDAIWQTEYMRRIMRRINAPHPVS